MTAGLYRARYSVTLEGPFLMAGHAVRAYGVDVSQLRADGKPVIPAGQARGVLRQAAEELIAVYNPDGISLRHLFGAGSADQSEAERDAAPMTAWQGTLSVKDLVAKDCPERNLESTRVRIDENTGAAKRGMLLTVETVALPGDFVTFEGHLHFPAADPEEARQTSAFLSRAVKLVPAIGAFKSVGYGRVEAAEIAIEGIEIAFDPVSVAVPGAGACATLGFSLDRPLMISPDLPESNILVGDSVIPGSVLKGALARKLRLAGHDPASGALKDAVSRLHVGHAFPWRNGEMVHLVQDHVALQRESDAAADSGNVRGPDAVASASLGESRGAASTVFAFFHDEKHEPDCSGAQSDDGLTFSVRTRTSIDPEFGSARDSELFTQAALETKDLEWRFDARSGGDTDTDALVWRTLLGGLFDIGKTRAIAGHIASADAPQRGSVSGGKRFRVQLEAPLHLCRSGDLKSEKDFADTVAEYWTNVTGSACRIATECVGIEDQPLYFASQKLVGGFPAAARRPFGDYLYEPIVLIDAGSVFILDATGNHASAAAVLDALARDGLPVSPRLPIDTDDFERTVHVERNGFGAITVSEEESL